MKSAIAKIFTAVAIFAAAVSCGKDNFGFLNPEITSGTLYIQVGQTVYLELPEGTIITEWKSSDQTVAYVYGGYVHGARPGSATISAKGKGHQASLTVIVTAIPITGFVLPTSARGYITQAIEIPVSGIIPEEADAFSIDWQTDAPEVAKVEMVEDHKVTLRALSSGEARLTGQGSDFSASCNITVLSPTISITPKSGTLTSGETLQLSFRQSPEILPENELKWSSSNSSIAQVDQSGLVTGGSTSGKAIITASILGLSATAEISVFGEDYELAFFSARDRGPDYRIDQLYAIPGCAIAGPNVCAYDAKDGKSITYGGHDNYTIYVCNQDGTKLPDSIVRSLEWSISGKKDPKTTAVDGQDHITVGSTEYSAEPCTITVKGQGGATASMTVIMKPKRMLFYRKSSDYAQRKKSWVLINSCPNGGSCEISGYYSFFVVMEDSLGERFLAGSIETDDTSVPSTASSFVSGEKWSAQFTSVIPYAAISGTGQGTVKLSVHGDKNNPSAGVIGWANLDFAKSE